MAAMGGKTLHHTDINKFLKNLLLRNGWSEFEIILQNYFLCDPFQKSSQNFDQSKNMAAVGGDCFHCVDFREILKNSSSLKPLVRF